MRRIGLTQRVDVPSHRNERRDALDQSWARLLLDMWLLPIPLPNRVPDVEMFVRELGLDGVILTGGNDVVQAPGADNPAAERDLFEVKLLDVCADREIPVLAVCRGLQIMVVHYGGAIEAVDGHVATRHPIKAALTDCLPLEDRDVVNSFHGFGISPAGLGQELVALAHSPDGLVEAVAHRSRPQWGIMWHPERKPFDRRDTSILASIFETVSV